MVDYFRWRQADATRCCLNGWCYWTMRKSGKTARQATAALDGLGFSEKNELLFTQWHNFAKLPAWQRLVVDENPPRGEGYAVFLQDLLSKAVAAPLRP